MDHPKIRTGLLNYILVTGWPPLALMFTGKLVIGLIVSVAFILVIPVSHGIGQIVLLCTIPLAWWRLRRWERNGFKEG